MKIDETIHNESYKLVGFNPPKPEKVPGTGIGKQCVFCGLRPWNRNKEHVLPLWLVSLTGDRNRTAFFTAGPRGECHFPFDQLTARACVVCNSKWSALESSSKPIMEGLVAGKEHLTHSEAITLLDWFDKVRIGLWLAGLSLTGNPFGFSPKFHIANRIGAKDRRLYLARANERSQRLTLGSIDHPVFMCHPAVLRLYVNGVAFVSASGLGIAGGPLGLPYLKLLRWTDPLRIEATVAEQRENWLAAPLRFGILAQAVWGHSVLDHNQMTTHAPAIESDGERSLVHSVLSNHPRVLDVEPRVVLPPPTLGRDSLLESWVRLALKLQYGIYCRESTGQEGVDRAFRQKLMTYMKNEMRSWHRHNG